jgi:aldose 1-epimerase
MSSFKRETYGTMPDGTKVNQFTLVNKNGMEMKVIEYGGIITHLFAPDRIGILDDIVLGHDSLEEYLKSTYFFGALIGRFGNRIAEGKFELEGKEYELETNNPPNHLHGGPGGFYNVVWKGEEFEVEDGVALRLTYTSPDGEEGYPGNLLVDVIYMLTDEDALEVFYTANTDKTTIINLTQHSYFNFTAMEGDVLDHVLSINADTYLPVNETSIPTGDFAQVEGTPFDFREPKPVGKDIDEDHLQLKRGNGYDHTFVLNNDGEEIRYAGSLYELNSGRFLEVYTTEPGMQFYSGNFLNEEIVGKGGKVYDRRTGLCLETQHFPDSPNQPDFPSVVLKPDEEFRSVTVFKFGVR